MTDASLQAPLLGGDSSSLMMSPHDGISNDDGSVTPREEGSVIVRHPMHHSDGSGDDETEPPWYSNPQQVMAMLSNFSTSYNVVSISLVLPILQATSRQQQQPAASEDAVAAVASSLLGGMILGQCVGGAVGDVLGVRAALLAVMALQVVASLGSALLVPRDDDDDGASNENNSIFWKLSLWRFVLGVGAGGVYPLAAVLSAGDKKKVRNVVLTFSTQGLGFVAVPLVTVTLLYTVSDLNVVWRIILGLGSLPGIILLILQWQSQHHGCLQRQVVPQHVEEPIRDDEPASDDENESVLDSLAEPPLPYDDGGQRYGWWASLWHEEDLLRKLLGTACTWFLFDVLFYGNTLFQPIVIEAAFGAREHANPRHLLQRTALDSLLLTSIALPGYFVAFWLLGKKSRFCYCGVEQTPRFVMLQGFSAMAVLYLIIGLLWKDLRRFPILLIVLYSLTFFFANYGPNTTTFILPSLVYSPECRSTYNGISAAAGKVGALVGASFFAPAADTLGDSAVMIICAVVAVAALVVTKVFVPNFRHDEEEAGTTPIAANATASAAPTEGNSTIV